jgi:probable F420-dependent oxidoreductase
MVRVITQLPNYDLYESQKVARLAESVGFDGVIALENAHNPFLPLAAAAMVTDKIQLGTAVAMAFPRAPTIAAHAAWDIQNASKGRFNLGLGAQVKAHNERRYGLQWSPPAPRMRDYIGAVRAVWNTWENAIPLDYHSDNYNLTLMTPNFSPKPNGLPRIPISMATVGPAMLRIAGEICDGVHLHPFSTRNYLKEVSNVRLAEGMTRGNRDRKNFEIVAGGFIATGRDAAAVAKRKEYVRFRIAFYCSTKAYWDILRLHGMEAMGEKLIPYPRENRWDEMAALIPEEMIDLFAVVADYKSLPKALEERYGGLADTISLQFAPDDDPAELTKLTSEIHEIPMKFEKYDTSWT